MSLVCEVCRVGRMVKDYVPYLHVNSGQVMIIPNVPALVCDQCQHTQHDPAFMDQVGELLSSSKSDDATIDIIEQEKAILKQSRVRTAHNNRRNS